MAIHDFDLARWLMSSEVERVTAEGTTLVCKVLESVGDIDNALINMRFVSGALGNIEVSRIAFYGYDIRTEILGSEGAVTVGVHQYTPVLLLTRAGAQHDITPYLMERFGDAYRKQLQHFIPQNYLISSGRVVAFFEPFLIIASGYIRPSASF